MWVLYILLRSDLDSLNTGKACAQVSHATSLFHKKVKELNKSKTDYSVDKDTFVVSEVYRKAVVEGYKDWKNETDQGFGTVIVLDAGEDSPFLHKAISQVESYYGLAGVVNDPTYPVRDGLITHHISLNTCAFAFLDEDNKECLSKYSLYR